LIEPDLALFGDNIEDVGTESAFTCNSQTSVENHAFRTVICTSCGTAIRVPVYCGDRFCPICSVGRLSRVRNRIKFLLQHYSHLAGYGIKHLTLTVRNQSKLQRMIKHIIASFRRLRQRAYWKNHVDGGVYVVEITGRPGNWHAHIHAIINASFMPYDTLKAAWLKVSGSPGLFIQMVPPNAAANYLTKYLTKQDGMPVQVSLEINQSIKGMRWFSPFGSWYKINCTYVKPIHRCKVCGNDKFVCSDTFEFLADKGIIPKNEKFYKLRQALDWCTETLSNGATSCRFSLNNVFFKHSQ